MRWLIALALILSAPRAASACAACACGDPTLTAMGEETASAGRLRLALELRHRGADHHEISTTEQRAALMASYAPLRPLTLAVVAPLVSRSAEGDRLTRFGELELWGRVTLVTDRDFAPRHSLQLVAGAKLPTGGVEGGTSDEIQPGTGSWDGTLGAAYTFRPASDWSAYGSAMVTQALVTGPVAAPETTGRASLSLQRGFGLHLAARAVADARLDSDGFVLLAGGDLLVSPISDLVLLAGFGLPITGDEHASFRLAVAVDL